MRILIYSIPSYADGDFPLIRALREAGHEVWYIVRLAPFFMHTTLFDIERMDARSAVLPASVYPELSRWGDYIDLERSFVSNDAVGRTGFRSFRLFLQEMRLVRRIAPDVVQHVGIPFLFQFWMLWKYRRKAVCVIHDPLPHSGEKSFRDTWKRRALAWIVPKFILLNRVQTESFCRVSRVPAGRVFHAALGPLDYYRRFGTGVSPEKGPYILFFGRFSPYKGIDIALEAFLAVRDACPDVRLLVAGAGPLCFAWPPAGGEAGIHLIHRYLTLDELADAVSHALFVVCPYTDATQSGVVQTAFALGTPVVATAVGNLPVDVEDGRCGLVVPPRNPEALAAAFRRLLDDPALLAQMRENIRFDAENGRHSWKRIVEQYIRAYQA